MTATTAEDLGLYVDESYPDWVQHILTRMLVRAVPLDHRSKLCVYSTHRDAVAATKAEAAAAAAVTGSDVAPCTPPHGNGDISVSIPRELYDLVLDLWCR